MKNLFVIVKALALSALLATSAFAAEKVNINIADAATLDRVLIGVGPSKAEAIVAFRKQNGAFRSADQMVGVKGIGLATIEKNRDRIMLGGVAPAAVKAGSGKTVAAKPVVTKAKTR